MPLYLSCYTDWIYAYSQSVLDAPLLLIICWKAHARRLKCVHLQYDKILFKHDYKLKPYSTIRSLFCRCRKLCSFYTLQIFPAHIRQPFVNTKSLANLLEL